MPPLRVQTTAQKRTFLETKWRQIQPHTGQLRARTLLLLNACPTSDPKDATTPSVAWTEFLNPTSVANSRRGQRPLLALPPRDHRVRRVIVGRGGTDISADRPSSAAATAHERPCGRRAAECGQQFPPSDGDCHTPLPREVRKGNDTTPRACCP